MLSFSLKKMKIHLDTYLQNVLNTKINSIMVIPRRIFSIFM
uniref:Uncharacterized protein n=1 Tax=Heterorhabditis bacteriophora TaxID=37862 RepID=A0A1I7X2M9_HETBA